MKLDRLILKKIIKIVATMSDFKAKMHQIRFRLGLRPRPSKGREGKGGVEGKRGEGKYKGSLRKGRSSLYYKPSSHRIGTFTVGIVN